MLSLIKDDDALVLVSDDKNAENALLQDALETAAPHMLRQFNNTEVDDDGLLRVHFGPPDYESLLEVIEYLDTTGDIDGEALEAMGQVVEERLGR